MAQGLFEEKSVLEETTRLQSCNLVQKELPWYQALISRSRPQPLPPNLK
jgi:hypothetical protein